MNLILNRLSVTERTIYAFTSRYSFSFNEVAEIKKMTILDVKQYLFNARRSIQESLKIRFISK
jgi:DNA-directed RNA polymerase specialized sigma24 family protein